MLSELEKGVRVSGGIKKDESCGQYSLNAQYY